MNRQQRTLQETVLTTIQKSQDLIDIQLLTISHRQGAEFVMAVHQISLPVTFSVLYFYKRKDSTLSRQSHYNFPSVLRSEHSEMMWQCPLCPALPGHPKSQPWLCLKDRFPLTLERRFSSLLKRFIIEWITLSLTVDRADCCIIRGWEELDDERFIALQNSIPIGTQNYGLLRLRLVGLTKSYDNSVLKQ